MDVAGPPELTSAGPATLTDAQIAAMTSAQRRDLISRLARPAAEVFPPAPTIRRIRTARLLITVIGCVVLVPWTVYLAATLPARYVASNWNVVWVGYDLFILAMLAATGWLTWCRRQAMVLASFSTGVLVLVDAWFDVMTARHRDVWLSLVVAIVIEIPVALLLMAGAVRLIRLTASRFWVLTPGMHTWQIPLMVLGGLDPAAVERRPRAGAPDDGPRVPSG